MGCVEQSKVKALSRKSPPNSISDEERMMLRGTNHQIDVKLLQMMEKMQQQAIINQILNRQLTELKAKRSQQQNSEMKKQEKINQERNRLKEKEQQQQNNQEIARLNQQIALLARQNQQLMDFKNQINFKLKANDRQQEEIKRLSQEVNRLKRPQTIAMNPREKKLQRKALLQKQWQQLPNIGQFTIQNYSARLCKNCLTSKSRQFTNLSSIFTLCYRCKGYGFKEGQQLMPRKQCLICEESKRVIELSICTKCNGKGAIIKQQQQQ